MRPFDTLRFSTNAFSAIVGGNIIINGGAELSGLCTDSREAKKGMIFLALRGEHTDGHAYLLKAAENGASCLVAEEIAEEQRNALPEGCSVILVPDTLAALGRIGAWYRKQIGPKIVAVTGSVGKTTTKEMLSAVLSEGFPTLSTEKNYNNEIGLPDTLLHLEKGHRLAVLEAGMNHAGELSRLSAICEPDIAVITNIGTSHLENLGSREGIRDAKLELLDSMKPGGTVLLNGDEPLLTEKKDELSARGFRVLTFGRVDCASDVFCENIRTYPDSSVFDLRDTKTGEILRDIPVPTAGLHNVGNAAAAILCGRVLGMTDEKILRGLSAFKNIRQTVVSAGEQTLILDCYNASPESMEAELCVLSSLATEKDGRAVAVLGDMLELGPTAPLLHEKVGTAVSAHGVSELIAFGPLSQHLAEGARDAGMDPAHIHVFSDLSDPASPAELLSGLLLPRDCVLFKASHSVDIGRIAAYLRK